MVAGAGVKRLAHSKMANIGDANGEVREPGGIVKARFAGEIKFNRKWMEGS